MLNPSDKREQEAYDLAHANSDVDNENTSQHHTLGRGATQAAQGNHKHEGVYSPVGHDHAGVYEPVPSDTDWIYPALKSGWQNHATAFGSGLVRFSYRKIKNVVYVRGCVYNNTGSTSPFTMPAGYTPPDGDHYTTCWSEVGVVANLNISTSTGVITVGGNNTRGFFFSYLVD